MKRLVLFAIPLLAAFATLLQCKDQGERPLTPGGPVSYVGAVHRDCLNDSAGPGPVRDTDVRSAAGGSRDSADDCYLKAHSYDGASLILTVHFTANCCPSFADSTRTADGVITIALTDTLQACRCMCPYEDDFLFECRDHGQYTVRFEVDGERCGFDTLLTIP